MLGILEKAAENSEIKMSQWVKKKKKQEKDFVFITKFRLWEMLFSKTLE